MNGNRTLGQIARLARRLRSNPVPYKVAGERRVIDETALAGITMGPTSRSACCPPPSARRCAATPRR